MSHCPDSRIEPNLVYAEGLRFMYAIVANPTPSFAPLIDEMAVVLRLNSSERAVTPQSVPSKYA